MNHPVTPRHADPEKTEKAADLPAAASVAAPPQRIGDFLLLRELGRGGFARVYLAHQVSLDRRVALKIARQPSRGEGQALAGLEHDHIVKVFAEFSDPASGTSGLVLQYIAGTSLAEVLPRLYRDGNRPTQGADILRAIDLLARDEVGFDPAALRDREVLSHGDYLTSVCHLGARLADALAFAHARGILHCDIKPGNILMNRYGRPLLADFNVAVPTRDSGDHSLLLGGTVLYMAPEQLAAFRKLPGGDVRKVGPRSDLYSLGLVLLEMIAGRLPVNPSLNTAAAVLVWKQQRPEEWYPDGISIPPVLWRVLSRCLAPEPADRFSSGVELAAALRHAAQLLEAGSHLATDSGLARLTYRRPIAVLLALVLLPHVVGSVVNIIYNENQVVLREEQQGAFLSLVIGYNLIVYPLCVLVAWSVLWPLVRALGRPSALLTMPTRELDRLRRRTLSLSNWAIVLALLGWLPGGFIFPVALHLATGALAEGTYFHFLLSFTLSGLIALVYSYFAAQFVMLRGLYPRFVHAETDPQQVQRELDRAVRGALLFQVLAALVPLTGAVLLLTLGPKEMTLVFRFLVVAMILAGMAGLGIAVWATHSLRAQVQVWKGVHRRTARPEGAFFG